MTKQPIKNQLRMNNILIEKRSHDFRHAAIKRVGGKLSYGKSETAILFLKVWSNFVEKVKAIGQYLIGESFFKKKPLVTRFPARAPLDPVPSEESCIHEIARSCAENFFQTKLWLLNIVWLPQFASGPSNVVSANFNGIKIFFTPNSLTFISIYVE